MPEIKVQAVRQLENGVITAVLLKEDNRGAVRPVLPAVVADALLIDDSFQDKKINYYWTPENKFVVYGLGKEVKAEPFRRTLQQIVAYANKMKAAKLQIVALGFDGIAESDMFAIALGEIPALASYQFNKYKKEVKEPNTLAEVSVLSDLPNVEAFLEMGSCLAKAVTFTRDLVNEPPNVLTPVELASRAVQAAALYGFKAEVFDKEKITALKMGGILAVNRGSQDPPTFTILEYKPENARNSKPIILVGKGVTFDTGGLTLKPTPGSMDYMKCDMAGAAAVIGAICAAAGNQLPVHVIGLIPSTDNRPGENAYTPNDVITMYDGTRVEVLNTDAEGRIILADALSYAKQYAPELVVDLATLTGAAVVAVGTEAIALMSPADDALKNRFKNAGERVFERIAELPLWPEYREQLNSDIADLKNIGGKYGGAITAGKFLEHFTGYPWVHLDIAGPAWNDSSITYRGKNGTGVGVRLLFDLLRNYGV